MKEGFAFAGVQSLASFVRSIVPMHAVATFLVIAVLLAIIGLAIWVVISEQINQGPNSPRR